MQINWVQKYGFNFSFAIKITANLIWTGHIEIRLLERGAILSIFAQLNPFNFYLSASPTTILSTGCYFQTCPNLPALFRIWSSNCFKETKFISELFFAPKVLELWGKKIGHWTIEKNQVGFSASICTKSILELSKLSHDPSDRIKLVLLRMPSLVFLSKVWRLTCCFESSRTIFVQMERSLVISNEQN